MTEEQYNKDLYCDQCGENKKLSYEDNYGGWDRYKCEECDHNFQIKAIVSK